MLRSARASSPSFGTGTEYSWTPLAGLSEEARSTSPSVICIKNFPVSSLLRSDHPKPSMTSDVSRKDCVAPLLYVLRGVRNGRALCAVVVDPELRVLRLQNRRNLSIDCSDWSRSKLKLGARRASKLARKCTRSPDRTTAPVLGRRT